MEHTSLSHESGWVRARIVRQFSELVRLSLPIVVQRLGIITMGIVDTVMVGRFSSQELAYQSIGYVPVATMIVISIGLMMGTMVLTSNAFGAEDYKKCGRIWKRSIPYGFAIGMIGFTVCLFGEPMLLLLGQEADISRGGAVMMQAIAFGIPMTNVMLACTFFLEGINRPLPSMIFIILANGINVFLNWILVYGHLGFEPMGAEGSAWATTIVRTFLAVALILYIIRMTDRDRFGILDKVDMRWKRWKRQRHLGYAAGITNGLEHVGFSALSVFSGWLGALSLAGMAIMFNVFGAPFMVAVGIAGATSVRVGIAYGRKDPRDLILAGSCGLAFNFLVMLPLLAALFYFPREIAALFTVDVALIEVATPLIILSAWMLMVDSGQTVMGSALRGRRDVWFPTFLYFLSYLAVMVPLAYYLAFNSGRGAGGLVESAVYASILSFVLLGGRFYLLSLRDFKNKTPL